MHDDPYDLQRFLAAQQPLYARACAELAAGRKQTHWMWFIFPQLRGLGMSHTARHFGIASLEEARAYLAHPTLGPRLRECTMLVNRIADRSVEAIFGYPDDLKFRSSMTLFVHAAGDGGALFREALQRYFTGAADPATNRLLGL